LTIAELEQEVVERICLLEPIRLLDHLLGNCRDTCPIMQPKKVSADLI